MKNNFVIFLGLLIMASLAQDSFAQPAGSATSFAARDQSIVIKHAGGFDTDGSGVGANTNGWHSNWVLTDNDGDGAVRGCPISKGKQTVWKYKGTNSFSIIVLNTNDWEINKSATANVWRTDVPYPLFGSTNGIIDSVDPDGTGKRMVVKLTLRTNSTITAGGLIRYKIVIPALTTNDINPATGLAVDRSGPTTMMLPHYLSQEFQIMDASVIFDGSTTFQ